MRVLLVSQEFPPETGWGGIGTYLRILAPALARNAILMTASRLGGRSHVHKPRFHSTTSSQRCGASIRPLLVSRLISIPVSVSVPVPVPIHSHLHCT